MSALPDQPKDQGIEGIQPMRHFNDFLSLGEDRERRSRYSLVMINSSTMDTDIVRRLWRYCDFKICADGGANRLFDGLKEREGDVSLFIPDVVKGDLDSLKNEVKEYYSRAGCSIIQDENQDHNDLDKCLGEIKSKEKENRQDREGRKGMTVIILGAFGGRFDQEIANVHALFKWNLNFERIVLLGNNNMAYLLTPGTHIIIPLIGVEGPGVSLLPLGCKVDSITTEGLKWDMNDQDMEMGKLISSSNCLQEGITSVKITTSHPVIWSATLTIPDVWRQ
jgi:thiamine pyrophosphokinase